MITGPSPGRHRAVTGPPPDRHRIGPVKAARDPSQAPTARRQLGDTDGMSSLASP